jgi:AraC family transcriptional regulator
MSLDDAVDFRFHNRSHGETQRLSHGWGVLDGEHVAMRCPKPYDFSLNSGRHYLALLNARRKDGETTADDLPRSTLKNIQGKLTFVPVGCRLQGWSLPETTPITFTAAYINPEVCSQLNAREHQLAPMLHFDHPLLTQLMLQLDRILAQPEMYSRVYVESLAIVLLAEIMHAQAIDLSQDRRATPRSPLKGGLASWQRNAVCDYIEGNLHQDISLAELAAIARLSPYHFCRAFKESVGMPPHRYQMSRRIERAKTLLADPALSITDAAVAVGYGSLSRFSALFRQVTGHSPRDYRRKMI